MLKYVRLAENGLSFIETSALDASNVESAFQTILTGMSWQHCLSSVFHGLTLLCRYLPYRFKPDARVVDIQHRASKVQHQRRPKCGFERSASQQVLLSDLLDRLLYCSQFAQGCELGMYWRDGFTPACCATYRTPHSFQKAYFLLVFKDVMYLRSRFTFLSQSIVSLSIFSYPLFTTRCTRRSPSYEWADVFEQ